MKVVFMGTPEIASHVLKRLTEEHEVICVYTQPPRPAGRKMQLQPSDVQLMAENLGIPVRSPTTLKIPEAQKEFAELNADVAVVCAYGLILPPAILGAPKAGCINIFTLPYCPDGVGRHQFNVRSRLVMPNRELRLCRWMPV